MPHQIETRTSPTGDLLAAAVFAQQDAWHQLGTTLADVFTAEDAMTVGHLGGWNVRKAPLTAHELEADGVQTIEVPDKYATIRTNPFTGRTEALGVVGSTYPAHPERTALRDPESARRRVRRHLRQRRLAVRRPAGLRQPPAAPDHEHRGSGPRPHQPRSAQQPRRHQRVPPPRHARPRRLRQHPGRGPQEPRGQHEHPPHHERRRRDRHRAHRARPDLRVRRGLRGPGRADDPAGDDDAEFDRLTADLFGQADTDAPRRTQNADQARTKALQHLWHHAPTQRAIKGTRWAGYQAVTEYIDHRVPVRPRAASGSSSTAAATTAADARARRLLTTDARNQLKARAWALCAA